MAKWLWSHSREKIKEDINQQESYLLLYDDQIAASAALVKGVDPLYTAIIEGSWSGMGLMHQSIVS